MAAPVAWSTRPAFWLKTQAFSYDAYGNLLATGFGAATQANALTSLLYSDEFTNAATGCNPPYPQRIQK